MAELDELARIQQAHHRRLLGVQDATGELVGTQWDTYAGLNDTAAAQFRAAAAFYVDIGKEQVGRLAAGYMAANDRLAGFAPAELGGIAPMIRNGVPTEDVYHRAIVEARARIAGGAPFTDAMAAGRARAVGTARTDITLANRSAMNAGAAARPWVVGYRRVLTGKSCALCATASTQRYRTPDLMPIHQRCDCDVAEIFGTEDPGRVINQQLLDDLQSAAAKDGRPDYWNGPYIVDADTGAIHYRRTEIVSGPDGKPLRTPSGTPRRRTVAGDPVKARTVHHGELGETLTDARHDLRPAGDITPDISPSAVRRTRAKPTDPDVIIEANRRNVSPERVVELRAEKAERRFLEQRARREAERAISVDSPEVRRIAERYGVHPDEVLTARQRLADVRAAARETAARVQADAMLELNRLGVGRIRNPPRIGARTATGSKARRGEWDWLEGIDARERARLSRNWYHRDGDAPDQLAARMSEALDRDVDDFEAIQIWLDLNRRAEAAGALRRGKLPSLDAYSGQIDADDLLQELTDDGYEVSRLFGDDLDAAGHIAQIERDLVQREALQYLGQAAEAVEGPSPYRMSYLAWHDELRTLEDRLAEGVAGAAERRRLAELVPEFIDEPDLSFEELYARIIMTARKAGEEVPAHATIAW